MPLGATGACSGVRIPNLSLPSWAIVHCNNSVFLLLGQNNDFSTDVGMNIAMWVLRIAIFNSYKYIFDELVMQVLFYGRPHLQVRWNQIHCSQKVKHILTEEVATQALL